MSEHVRAAIAAREAAKSPPPPPEPEPKRRKRETVTERTVSARIVPASDSETFAADEGVHE